MVTAGLPWTASTWPPGWNVLHVAATGSTNADLLDPDGGYRHRTVLVADHQTAGRGRLDRRWDAPPQSNLLASMLFAVDAAPSPGELIRRVSLAAVAACRTVAPDVATPESLRLKWPNDLLLDGRKLAGVLAELRGDHVAVGIGLNVGWAPDGAARLGGDGGAAERSALLAALLGAYDALPVASAELLAGYRRELATIGRDVTIATPNGEVAGTAVDVDDDGRLLVDTGSEVVAIDVGDVGETPDSGVTRR